MSQGTRTDLATKPAARQRFQPRIGSELHARLKQEADRRQVSVAYLVTRAIENLLADLEGQELP